MVARGDITWEVSLTALPEIEPIRDKLGEAEYLENVRALQDFLAGYFSADLGCKGKLGASVSPLGANRSGAKKLKVRWALPGGGKSGGLRMAFLADCKDRRVLLAGIFPRDQDPSDEDFDRAFKSAEAK